MASSLSFGFSKTLFSGETTMVSADMTGLRGYFSVKLLVFPSAISLQYEIGLIHLSIESSSNRCDTNSTSILNSFYSFFRLGLFVAKISFIIF